MKEEDRDVVLDAARKLTEAMALSPARTSTYNNRNSCKVSGEHSGWPRWSDSIGVSPHQIEEERERLKKHGITDVEFDEGGRIKLNSPQHQQQVLATMSEESNVKYVNKDGFGLSNTG